MGAIPHVGGYPGDFAVQGGALIGFWNQPLASLHANPAHSALRRVRHFEDARNNVERLVGKNRVSASDDFGFSTQRYLMSQARRRQMWSVR